jgi:hypothetical protein
MNDWMSSGYMVGRQVQLLLSPVLHTTVRYHKLKPAVNGSSDPPTISPLMTETLTTTSKVTYQ